MLDQTRDDTTPGGESSVVAPRFANRIFKRIKYVDYVVYCKIQPRLAVDRGQFVDRSQGTFSRRLTAIECPNVDTELIVESESTAWSPSMHQWIHDEVKVILRPEKIMNEFDVSQLVDEELPQAIDRLAKAKTNVAHQDTDSVTARIRNPIVVKFVALYNTTITRGISRLIELDRTYKDFFRIELISLLQSGTFQHPIQLMERKTNFDNFQIVFQLGALSRLCLTNRDVFVDLWTCAALRLQDVEKVIEEVFALLLKVIATEPEDCLIEIER